MKVYFFESHSKSLIKTLSNIEHYSFYYTIVLGRLSSFFVVDISRDGFVLGLIILFMIIWVGSGQYIYYIFWSHGVKIFVGQLGQNWVKIFFQLMGQVLLNLLVWVEALVIKLTYVYVIDGSSWASSRPDPALDIYVLCIS